jgi:hypothetical protein
MLFSKTQFMYEKHKHLDCYHVGYGTVWDSAITHKITKGIFSCTKASIPYNKQFVRANTHMQLNIRTPPYAILVRVLLCYSLHYMFRP